MKTSLAILILATSVSAGLAQRGTIEGVVKDSSGKPLQAEVEAMNVLPLGYTDSKGWFRRDVPAGTQWLLIFDGELGCVAPVHVPSGGIVRAEFVVNDRKSSIYQKQMQEYNRRGIQISIEGGVPTNSTYTGTTTNNGFELSARYCLAMENDSVLVNVIAQARNMSDNARPLCGSFSMWATYGVLALSHDGVVVAQIPDSIPRLDVPGLEARSKVLDCDEVFVAPGQLFERGMSFRFDPRTFARWPGALSVTCYFNSGRPGSRWERTDCFYIGQVNVPIRPIGQPMLDN